MWSGIRRWGAGIAIGAVASAALLGGATFVMAQTASSPSTIQACVNRLGMIRIVKSNSCAAYETYTTWNQQGEQGPPGDPGSAGVYEVTFSDSFIVPVSLGGQTLHCDVGDVAVNRSASILPDPVSSDLTASEVWDELAPGQWQAGWRFTATNITPQTSTFTTQTLTVFCLDRGAPHGP